MDIYGVKEFKDLKTSTSTIMIYTNIEYNIKEIFQSLPLEEIEVPLTKKQKNVDKKKLSAPYGSIISMQCELNIRGLNLRKNKKHWCTVCRPIKVSMNSNGVEKETKVNTITEVLEKSKEGKDIWAVKFYCSSCQITYDPRELKTINHFLNQLTIVLSIGKQPILNIMLFKDNLKIAGCKSKEDAMEAILILWQDYLVHKPNLWKLNNREKIPKYQLDSVMRNVGFRMGFALDRQQVNMLLNDAKYSNNIFMSQYESTGQTSVNIKMYSKKPDNFVYDCLTIPFDSEPYVVKIPTLTYKKKENTKGSKYVTAIIFSSSEVILSGRYDDNMKEMYEFLVKTIFENRDGVKEIINEPNLKNITKITRKKGSFIKKREKLGILVK